MQYKILILRSAEKEMDQLPVPVFKRISIKILSLESNPRPKGIKKLSGRDEYRLRVSNYRILYNISDTDRVVTVISVVHRREAYR
jgi:mRNA interferase RelE/StbE